MIVYGNELAARLKENMKAQVEALKAQGKRVPLLSVILVGDNPASQSYVRSKEKACISIGMENRTIVLPEDISQEELEQVVCKQNEDDAVDGILVQLPLPKGLDEQSVIDKISPLKDVDGLHPVNAGALLTNRKGFVPCTPKGVMAMLESIGLDDLSGLNAAMKAFVLFFRKQLITMDGVSGNLRFRFLPLNRWS